MKFWQQISGKFKKPDTTGGQKAGKEPFLIKYRSFQELLSQNNAVLELMAEIEEKLSGDAPVLSDYLIRSIHDISGRVKMIIYHLNQLSKDKYLVLYEMYDRINSEIEEGLSMLQSEHLGAAGKEPPHVPADIKGYGILAKGIIASRGIGSGSARIVKTEGDIADFPEGAVLIAKNASTRYAALVRKASAIVTDVGAVTVHMATVAREFSIPMLVGTGAATQVIRNGQEITVDAINGIVYEKRVKELSERPQKRAGYGRDEQAGNILRRIIPLNLINPDDERFSPGFCKTLHDITRYAHQKAMYEMFKISEEVPEDIGAKRLIAGIPLNIYIIDLGHGIEGLPDKLGPEHIRSIPFHAFLKGLTSVIWPEPRHVDLKGFLGMMAHTASIPEAELEQTGENSFAFISGEYMNFSVRLGYHLSVIEAYTGENINDNYIRFFFQGGGADIDRRLRRIRLISGILRRLDFNVKVTEDIIEAIITKYGRSHLEERLEILGRLTVYTKQMDAIMHDDASTELYMEEFIREHVHL